MKSKIALIFLLTLLSEVTTAQSVTGSITDTQNEILLGATVIIQETNTGATTNLNGNFFLEDIGQGNFTLIASYIGYLSDTTKIQLVDTDLNLSIVLSPRPSSLTEVIIQADRITERTAISNISFSNEDLQTGHGLTEDPLRTVTSLPGIGSGGDLYSPSTIFVRGGDPNENLFLLDNNKIYFPYYIGGQKSIFNTDITESVELLTGGFSAMYGNHMSSVLNVTTRDGDMKRLKGMISMGFYNSSGIIEGPIKKEKTSFLVAVRRTYLDLFIKESPEFPVPSFGDISYKFAHIINDQHKISLSGMSSDESLDFLAADPKPGLPNKLETSGNNHFQTLQLQSKFSDKIYNKLSVTNALSNTDAKVGNNLNLDIDAWQAGIRNDLSYYINTNSKIRAGILWQYGAYDFEGTLPLNPLQIDPNDTTIVLRNQNINSIGETQRSAYVLYDGILMKGLGINAGLRYDYNPDNTLSDISPRLAINYQLSEKSKLRLASGIYSQFPSTGVPNDLSSEQSIHYIIGYEYKFSQNIYGWVEGYLKDYKNLVIFDDQLNYSNNGEGTAKGIELFLRKEKGMVNGWISYALSHSQRTAPLGKTVKDFTFDQRHIFNLVTQVHMEKWEKEERFYLPVLLRTSIRYADGMPYTPLEGALQTSQGWQPIEGDELSERNTDYININMRIEWRFKVGKKSNIRATSFMEAWNILGRKNVLGRNYQYGSQYSNNLKTNEYYTTPFLMAGGFQIHL